MLFLLLATLSRQAPTIAQLDKLATARDVQGLTRFVEGLPGDRANPLDVLKTNGAYETGRYGWRALGLKDSAGEESYAVLTTPLTSEDIGEFLFKRNGAALDLIPEDDSLGVQVVRHDFDLHFDIPNEKVNVVDNLTLDIKGTGDFVFRMGPNYTVKSISNSTGNLTFRQKGGVVLLAKPAEGRVTYKVVYEGLVKLPQYAGSISNTEATLANEYWYPMIAREPAPYSVTVHGPKGWTTVGQGARIQDIETDTEHIAKFKMDLPVVYYSLSTGPYKFAKVSADGRSFFCWSPRLNDQQMADEAATYIPIIRFYERFSKFPFHSYGALDSPAYGGGALEAYSYATYGGGLPNEDAHEPSHTWWGGIIDNTYLHSFWNESFAVFSDGLYHRETSIGNDEERRQAFVDDGNADETYLQYACSQAGADRGPIASSLGYGKGSKVLQMLEQLMGTSSMIGAMHRWIVDQPVGKPGEWEDFEHAAEAERPDLHLEDFFADWLDRQGYVKPKATVSFLGHSVQVDYSFEGDPYRIPLDVMLIYPDGRKKLQTFDVRDAKTLTIDSLDKPSIVSIDPHRRLVRIIGNDERPTEWQSFYGRATRVLDAAHTDWKKTFGGSVGQPPADLNNVLLIGSPDTFPAMAPLCEKAGFQVSGNSLTYKGTTIDLTKGAAVAVIDLGHGKRCGIALGQTRIRPNSGRARTALFDELGRFLRGETDPKTAGTLTYKIQ